MISFCQLKCNLSGIAEIVGNADKVPESPVSGYVDHLQYRDDECLGILPRDNIDLVSRL